MVDKEALGPADRIINMLLAYSDHMVHNRPGIVSKDATSNVGVKWAEVTHKVEKDQKIVYLIQRQGKNKTTKIRHGILQDNGQIKSDDGKILGDYRRAGLFPEVATWMYGQVAEVWKLDNEFAARWASYAFKQEHRDLKVVLAAFLLVQSRKGDPVMVDGKAAFFDEDYRNVGEAMLLLQEKDRDFDAKLLLRVYDLLNLPGVKAINRDLGFGRSARRAFHGRWEKGVEKWLRYREQNPRIFAGLVKSGQRVKVMNLARRIGYKPETPKFFEVLRWKQVQKEDGRRQFAIGKNWAATETWEGQTEEQICQRIVGTKPSWKVIVGRVPKAIGITRAITAAAIEAGSFSDKDLVIATPTLEDLGLLNVQDIRERWERAVKNAEDMRSVNIARNVKSQATRDVLIEAGDKVLKEALVEVTKGIRVYFMVDISSSMNGAIGLAKQYLARFLQAFPPDKIHIAIFNTVSREITLPHPSAAGVEMAFRGIVASGGTDYAAPFRGCLEKYRPSPEEDVLFLYIGDEGHMREHFDREIVASGLNPMAIGLVPFVSVQYGRGKTVRVTAERLGIPCFEIDEKTFADPYAIPRTLRALVAATPIAQKPERVVAPARQSLIDLILKTDLLKKPAWATA